MADSASPLEAMRTDISFHPVAGGAVLFSAADSRLYALNETAGLTWLCIREGLSASDCIVALANAFHVDHAVAAAWCDASRSKFQELGLLNSAPAAATSALADVREAKAVSTASPAGSSVSYRIFEHDLHIVAPPELRPAIDSLLGSMRVDGPATDREKRSASMIVIAAHGGSSDGSWDIALDGRVEASCDAGSVAAEVERLVTQTVVPATPHLLTLHAAALQRDGQTLLLAGPSGAGKTTLSVALARAGWSFASDEIVLLGRALDLHALPYPPCIKAEAFGLIEAWFPELRAAPAHRRYDKTVKYLPIQPSPLSRGPTSIAFPRFEPGAPDRLESLTPFAGLERLLAQCVFVPPGFDRQDVERLLRWHDELHYYDIYFSDSDAGVQLAASVGSHRPRHAC